MLSKRVLRFLSLVLLLGGGVVLGGCSESKSATPAASPADFAGPTTQSTGPAAYPSQPEGSAPVEAQSSVNSTRPSPSPAPADAPSGAAPRSAAAPPPPPATTAADSKKSTARTDAAPEPSTRPGLGTEFGESRESRVHDVAFVRDASRPFAIASMSYNDKKGVDALAASAKSHESCRSVSAASGAVTISIRDASGNPLEAVHAGARTLVVGQAGQRYSIVLENHTSHRFEAVGTVDGLDVINGKPGTFDNRGYVLMPFATLTIDGFRTSSAAVAAFRFATVSDSYAAQTGSARNVGVIGMAFFSERGDAFVPESETRMRETASPFPADPRFSQPPPGR